MPGMMKVESDLPPGFLADAASPSCTAADLKGALRGGGGWPA